MWQFPQGEAYYNYLLRHYTTTDLTAEQIHELGLQEVTRIQAEMRALFDQLGYPQDASLGKLFERVSLDSGVISGEQVLQTYDDLIREAEANLDPAFIRRLRYVLEFPQPDAAQRHRIWRQITAELAGTEIAAELEPSLERLAKEVPLTGAQIKYAILAALFMARTSAMVRGAALGQFSPAEALERANELIISELHSELLLTALYAELDVRSGRTTFVNAGHYWPLWLHAETGEVEPLSLPGIILGAIPGIALKEETVTVAPGDTVVLYSDGVTDAMAERREAFGEQRLQAVVSANRGASAAEMAEAIVRAVQAHVGGTPQYDDLTLLVVRRSPTPPV